MKDRGGLVERDVYVVGGVMEIEIWNWGLFKYIIIKDKIGKM